MEGEIGNLILARLDVLQGDVKDIKEELQVHSKEIKGIKEELVQVKEIAINNSLMIKENSKMIKNNIVEISKLRQDLKENQEETAIIFQDVFRMTEREINKINERIDVLKCS